MSENEKKVRSIRADEEVFAKFKAICEETGGQNEGLAALISAYELSTAKKLLSGQADSISDFQTRVDGIVKAYISALEITAGTEERVRNEFRAQLDSQTQTIISLQQRTAALESDLSENENGYKAQIGELNGEIIELKAALEKSQDTAQTAVIAREQSDKIARLATDKAEQLTADVQELTVKADQSDSYKTAAEQTAAELDRVKSELAAVRAELQKAQENAAAQLNAAAERHSKELAFEIKAAKAEVREKYQDRIDTMQQQHTEQIKALQDQHAAQIAELIERSKPKSAQ